MITYILYVHMLMYRSLMWQGRAYVHIRVQGRQTTCTFWDRIGTERILNLRRLHLTPIRHISPPMMWQVARSRWEGWWYEHDHSSMTPDMCTQLHIHANTHAYSTYTYLHMRTV
jgi:MoaA/NifB/PqqE/SkfB family radical SAM enzyme